MKFFGKKRNNGKTTHPHVQFEWNQIDEHIFLGTNVCCQTHFDQELLSKGVLADVSMEEERVDAAQGVKTYLWLPTVDHTAPDVEQLMIGAKSIDEMIAQDYKVYIHCKNGHGRAPTMLAAYYLYKGFLLREAIEKIKKRTTGNSYRTKTNAGLKTMRTNS